MGEGKDGGGVGRREGWKWGRGWERGWEKEGEREGRKRRERGRGGRNVGPPSIKNPATPLAWALGHCPICPPYLAATARKFCLTYKASWTTKLSNLYILFAVNKGKNALLEHYRHWKKSVPLMWNKPPVSLQLLPKDHSR
jgi:hypothetical protein